MLHRGHFIRKDHQRMVVWIVVAADWPDFDPHHFHVCLMVAMSNVRINRGEECNQKEARMEAREAASREGSRTSLRPMLRCGRCAGTWNWARSRRRSGFT